MTSTEAVKVEVACADGGGVRRAWGCAVVVSAGYLYLAGAADAVHATFTASTVNAGSALGAGTVTITDSSPGTGLYTLTNTKPGDATSACTLVRYTGSVLAGVRSYAATTGGLGPYVNLTVTRGTASSAPGGSCATFAADSGGGVLYSGTLAGYPTGWSTGVADPTGRWTQGEAHAYRITVAVQDAAAAQGTTASTTVSWEARS